MNTHRAVARFLAKEENKTELASERVELAVIDDIRSDFKIVASQRDSVVDALKKVSSEAKKGLSAANDGLKKVDEFKKKAKDLGIDLPKIVVNAEKQLTERKKDFEQYLN